MLIRKKVQNNYNILLSSPWFTEMYGLTPSAFPSKALALGCHSSHHLLTHTPHLLSEPSLCSQEFQLCSGRASMASQWPPHVFLSPSAARLCPLQGVVWTLAVQRFGLSLSHRLCDYVGSGQKLPSCFLGPMDRRLGFWMRCFFDICSSRALSRSQAPAPLFFFLLSSRERPCEASALSLIALNLPLILYHIFTLKKNLHCWQYYRCPSSSPFLSPSTQFALHPRPSLPCLLFMNSHPYYLLMVSCRAPFPNKLLARWLWASLEQCIFGWHFYLPVRYTIVWSQSSAGILIWQMIPCGWAWLLFFNVFMHQLVKLPLCCLENSPHLNRMGAPQISPLWKLG